MSKVRLVTDSSSGVGRHAPAEADPASRLRAEFRYRETRFLARQARRVAIVARLPWWLHWLMPPPTRSRFW
jgi:hypothetical protein